MKVIKYGEHNIAFGLQWTRLPCERISAEISAALEERNASHGLVRKISDEYDVRQQLGIADDKSTHGAYSAAAILAEVESTIILVDKISDDDFWLCAVSDKEILPGGDLIGSAELIKEKLDDILVEFGSDNDGVKFVISASAESILGISGDYPYSFEEFVFKNEGALNKSTKIGKVKKLPKLVLVIAAVLAIGGGSYFAINPENEHVAALQYVLPGDTPFQALERVNLPLGPSEADILSAALMEEIRWLRDDFELYAPDAVIGKIFDVINTIPKQSGGWEAINISFDTKRLRDAISVDWERGSSGNSQTLVKSVAASEITFSEEGETARTVHPVSSLKKRDIGRDVLEHISSSTYGLSNFIDDMQILDVAWKLQTAANTARPVKIDGIKSNNVASKRQLNQRFREFTISHDSILTLLSASALLSEADTVLIRSVSIDPRSNSWKITGEIYEK